MTTKIDLPSSCPPPPPSRKLTYDVFLSFRGTDTRTNFTDHLYAALKQKGIYTFRDDEELNRWESIGPNLLVAIEESRYVIVVFSQNYANSSWCLDELAIVAECRRAMGQTVLPVFYHVDPSDVRRQTGEHFGKAFEKHQERFGGNPDKLQRWKDALAEVGNLSGWHLKDRYESEVIQEIVEKIFTELNQIIPIAEGLVGMDSHLNEMLPYLDIGCPDVRIIGICGMGGIGKTTIAQVVFERLQAQFEGCSFLENVREVTEKQGAVHLQEQLLSNLLRCSVNVQNTRMGKNIMRQRLRTKMVLIILDDVDQEEQLEALCDRESFGPGSRIIITSRDEHLLSAVEGDKVYKVNPLTDAEALELFCMEAFKKDQQVGKDYLELSKEFLKYANGLPLAIKIFGSYVRGRSVKSWSRILDRLKNIPADIEQLKMYVFLFPSVYEFREDELVQMWMAEGFIEESQTKRMEDIGNTYFNLLRKIGFLVPSRCDTRVAFDSVFSVPTYNPGNLFYKVNPVKLSELVNTTALVDYFAAEDGNLDGALEKTQHLSLKCKEISEMTFGILKNFKRLRTLVLLHGHGSSIKHVPRDLFLSLKYLRTLNLSRTLISEVPSSIRNAKSLRYLDLSSTPIRQLPESIDSLHHVQTIKLRGCAHFLQLPKGMKKLINLRHIDLDIIRQLRAMPPYIGNLTNLQTLSAFLVGREEGCRIGELKNLNNLRGVLRISRLENVSDKEEAEEAALIDKKYLQRLELRWSNVFTEKIEGQEKILECLQPHAGLKELQIQHYAGSTLPTWISNPSFAELLVLTLYRCTNCQLLPSIGQLRMLKSLSIIEMNGVKEINHQFFRDGLVDQAFPAFPKLEILEVDIMFNLKEWREVKLGDLPSLLKLTMDSCPELDCLPSLSWLKSLKHLEFRRCPKLLSLP